MIYFLADSSVIKLDLVTIVSPIFASSTGNHYFNIYFTDITRAFPIFSEEEDKEKQKADLEAIRDAIVCLMGAG